LCGKEKEFLAAQSHPKLVRLVSKEIDRVASELGFSEAQIRNREFRAERDGDHIIRLLLG
jgi:hypothetical protein